MTRAWPALLLGLACAGPAPVLDTAFDERVTVPIEELVARAELAADQDVRVVELGRDAHASQQLVAIRHGETPHRHDRHDLTVVILRGHGTMRLGDETRPVGQGSITHVPRGRVHAFTNQAPEPAVAWVLYAPPFDGEDRVPADAPRP